MSRLRPWRGLPVPTVRRSARCWLLLCLLLLLPPAAPGSGAPLPYQADEFLVTGATGDQFAPAAAGTIAVWSEERAAGAVIRGKNLLTGAEFDITAGTVDPLAVRENQLAPAISGGIVVWQNRGVNSSGAAFDRIYGRDLTQPTTPPFAIAATRGSQLRPAISGATVVWADNRRGNWDIFGYDLIGQREFVVTSRPGDQLWPTISDSIVVWADESDDGWQIAGRNLATGEEFAISTAPGNQTAPAISGSIVVWEDTRRGRTQFDIYGYDLARRQEFAVTTARDYQIRPTIAGDLVVWEDYRSGERDLWGYDLRAGREFQVTNAPGVQWQPFLTGNLLVWSDARAGAFDVFGAWLRKTTFVPVQGDPHAPAFTDLWRQTDGLVAAGEVERTWLWGPAPFATGREAYAEAPGGQRLVQYYDKSRMEVTNPRGDRASPWYVTNGLLVKEMITGQLQVGHSLIEPLAPAQAPVAGDPDDLLGPTYTGLAGLLGRPAGTVGAPVVEAVDRNGAVRRIQPPAAVGLAYVVPETGHAIADVFWQFLNGEGPVQRGEQTAPARLFDPPFFASGLPITEPYWTRATVGGVVKDVLLQCFERRCLTYTPDNPEGWRVEMGNVGRHYYRWRYGTSGQ